MTRLGFFLFNILLVAAIYGLAFLNSAKHVAIHYALMNFSVPYIALILLMSILTTIRWFMTHNPDTEREIVTWMNALWFLPVLTILAIYLAGGIEGNFWQGLRGLFSVHG